MMITWTNVHLSETLSLIYQSITAYVSSVPNEVIFLTDDYLQFKYAFIGFILPYHMF